jgi:hypothetical protein
MDACKWMCTVTGLHALRQGEPHDAHGWVLSGCGRTTRHHHRHHNHHRAGSDAPLVGLRHTGAVQVSYQILGLWKIYSEAELMKKAR